MLYNGFGNVTSDANVSPKLVLKDKAELDMFVLGSKEDRNVLVVAFNEKLPIMKNVLNSPRAIVGRI